ncbi:F0F1 ATP synthase subunit epsilon [Xylophilus sp.]|uniref:F0F1 ATP synthase subunit epsilon n=1 Tax=Xylophilus sp. TaxID=2653893 RepID=UPI0013BB50B3|nr:F0F1 ATP synthase subunit epsilon [Xylophilus sp.]KAF1045284.1 MAG: ATP synthase epsilon chain [Xylophilus sp.]
MTPTLALSVATPLRIALRDDAVTSLRAEDASGDFGIRPGHADFLTVIGAGVVRWLGSAGHWRYAALRGGVLAVTGGRAVRIACREAVFGDDLASLQARVAAARAEALDAARRARAQGTQLHARAIRQLMRQLSGGADTPGLNTEDLQ